MQTAPVPLNDPPVQPYLHGFDSGAAAVQVAWRDGLLVEDPFDDEPAEEEAARAGRVLAAVPVRTTEIAEVPFVAVRQWMLGQQPGPVSDLEAAPDAEDVARPRRERDPFRVLAWRSDPAGADPASGAAGSWRWIDGGQLRPGDRIVVPSGRGGLDQYGWAPADRTPVVDVSEAATFTAARSYQGAMLRLDPGLPARLGLSSPHADAVAAALADLAADEFDTTSREEVLTRLVVALRDGLPADPPDGGWTGDTWSRLREWTGRRLRVVDVQDDRGDQTPGGWTPRPLVRLLVGPSSAGDRAAVERDDEEVASSSIGTSRVTLDTHLAAVRVRAGQISAALGLPPQLQRVVEDAARWHDLGKVEERFQVMLHGGDAFEAALAPEPLAKSGMDPADRLAWHRATRASRLPAGARHEAWSAALVEEHLAQADRTYEGDVDLLLHLIASHHGHARPFLPLVLDHDPRPVEALLDGEKVSVRSERTVSLDHPGRFARLNDRYGRWGLALLESVVRCADMTVSGEGS